MFTSTAEWNESDWRRPDFDELLFKARRTVDEAERTQIYHELQRMARDEAGLICCYYMDTIIAARRGITWEPPSRSNFWNFREIDIEV